MPRAVVFDLDGVLMDSEQRWNGAKEALTAWATVLFAGMIVAHRRRMGG